MNARMIYEEYRSGRRSEVDGIIAFESGDSSDAHIVALFAHLVRSGRAWTLQGSYGRIARSLIDAGILSRDGEILQDLEDRV